MVATRRKGDRGDERLPMDVCAGDASTATSFRSYPPSLEIFMQRKELPIPDFFTLQVLQPELLVAVLQHFDGVTVAGGMPKFTPWNRLRASDLVSD